MNKIKTKLTCSNFFYDDRVAISLWFGLAIIGIIVEVFHKGTGGNYTLFKGVYEHTIHQANLFIHYPEYEDINHYGPFFSLIILPFYYLPDKIGIVLWVIFNAGFLYVAIRQLPILRKYQNAILVFSAHELMLASEWQQTNQMVAGCVILGFIFINKGKEIWATFFLLFATFIKLYGIVGFAFFFFSNNKIKLILWSIAWSALFFVAPMLISTPQFIVQSYFDWYNELVFKANKNVRLDIGNDYQDISVMGMIRRIFKFQQFKNIYVTLPAIILFARNYFEWKHFADIRFKLYLLCLVLLMTVVFTTSAESPTYIIAFPAVCIWFVMQPPAKWVNYFLVFALLLTSFSYSDIFTPYVREHLVRPYSLKALPCFIMWCIITYQIYKKQFLKIDLSRFTSLA